MKTYQEFLNEYTTLKVENGKKNTFYMISNNGEPEQLKAKNKTDLEKYLGYSLDDKSYSVLIKSGQLRVAPTKELMYVK